MPLQTLVIDEFGEPVMKDTYRLLEIPWINKEQTRA
jgi:hypothetical protein